MTEPVGFFADTQALASLKQDAKAQDPAALREAARQFESLFAQMLLRSMREANKSFGGDSLFGSDQADFYQDMFDSQMALHLSKGKGLGLADMLIRQLTMTQGGSQATDAPASAPQATRATSESARTSAARSATGPSVASSKADFVRKFLPHAEAAARELGVDPHVLLAQAALETGWGRAVPTDARGDCSYNFFGIKATGRWSGRLGERADAGVRGRFAGAQDRAFPCLQLAGGMLQGLCGADSQQPTLSTCARQRQRRGELRDGLAGGRLCDRPGLCAQSRRARARAARVDGSKRRSGMTATVGRVGSLLRHHFDRGCRVGPMRRSHG